MITSYIDSARVRNAIEPKYVVFTCAAGSTEYTNTNANTFPAQAAINRIAKHTDKCYVTTLCTNYDAGEFESMNGDIMFVFNSKGSKVVCNNNYTLLKDTQWFINNRQMPEEWKAA